MYGKDHQREMKPRQFVEVFITNVDNATASKEIQVCLANILEGSRVSFDMEDADRVLRIASPSSFTAEGVIHVIAMFGYSAEVMKDEVAEVAN
jgi:hypothetical protein